MRFYLIFNMLSPELPQEEAQVRYRELVSPLGILNRCKHSSA